MDEFFRLRHRYGITRTEAHEWMLNTNYFGAMMVHMGDADGFIAGVSQHYPETIRPALQIIRTRPGVDRVSGLYVMATNKNVYFFADTTVNIESDRRASGGNRHSFGGSGALVQRGAARGHALVLEFRQHPPSPGRQSSPRHRARQAKGRGSRRGWRNDGATRPSSRN